MKQFFQKIKDRTTAEKVVVRVIMAWILTSLCFFIKSDGNFATAIYAQNINTIMFLCYVALFFISFCALGMFEAFRWVEIYGPSTLIVIYGVMSVNGNTNTAYVLGLMLVLAVSLVYAVNKTEKQIEFKRNSTVVILYIVAAVFYVLVAGGISLFRHMSYQSGIDDVGNTMHMFYSMRDGIINLDWAGIKENSAYFFENFSPMYYVFLPVYILLPWFGTLLVLQVIMIVSGLIPLVLLCNKFNINKAGRVAFALIYVMFPALSCGCYTGLYENCLLVPALLWMFYFIEQGNSKIVAIMSIFTLLICEESVVYVACIGIFLMVNKRKYIGGLILFAGSIGYYVLMVNILKHFGGTEISMGLSNYIVDGEGTILDVIRNFIVNPAYVLEESFSAKKLIFLLLMLLPLGFMPLFNKNISRLVLLLPLLLINLAPDYPDKYSIYDQYAFGTAAIFMYMMVSNYGDMEDKTKRYFCAIALCASIVFVPTGALSDAGYVSDYFDNQKQYQQLSEAIQEIPKDSSVAASELFLAHVAAREQVYQYPCEERADVVILDCRNNRYDSRVIRGLEKRGYAIKEYEEDFYIILIKQ